MTDRYALVGHPIAHSPSPAMQNSGFRAISRDALYVLQPTTPEQVESIVDQLHDGTLSGCNITTPLKGEFARRFLGSDRVVRSRSANTIYQTDNGLRVESTDVDGVLNPLRNRGIDGGDALLIGAGGAARAAALALESLGLTVHVAARDPSKGSILLEEIAPRPRGRSLPLFELERDKRLLRELRVVIQATPLGRHGESLPLPWEFLETPVCFEMLYANTAFLEQAAQHGCTTIPGWEMLLEQGLKSFELWTGVEAPRRAMQRGLMDALRLNE